MPISKEDVTKDLLELLSARINIEDKEITLESSLYEDLGLDSFDGIELVFDIEDKFGIRISDEEIDEFMNAEDIINLVYDKLKEKTLMSSQE